MEGKEGKKRQARGENQQNTGKEELKDGLERQKNPVGSRSKKRKGSGRCIDGLRQKRGYHAYYLERQKMSGKRGDLVGWQRHKNEFSVALQAIKKKKKKKKKKRKNILKKGHSNGRKSFREDRGRGPGEQKERVGELHPI